MQSFDEIYAAYFSEVYRFLLSLCHDPDLAEEITQEAFFRALKNIDSFKGNCRIGTWLCIIAKNTFYSYMKKQKRQADIPLDTLISDENIEEQFEDRETAFAIHEALHKLKEPYKEVFWLRTFGDLSFAQIGTLFDRTENWARVTYYRARVMIREEIK